MSAVGQDVALAFYGVQNPDSDFPLNSQSSALENARRVLSGHGILYGFTAYSSKGVAQFVLVFDTNDVPANGATTGLVFNIAATSNVGVNWVPGRVFRRGCVLVNSSTAPALTIGAADCLFDAQYA